MIKQALAGQLTQITTIKDLSRLPRSYLLIILLTSGCANYFLALYGFDNASLHQPVLSSGAWFRHITGCATQTINTSFNALPSDDSMAYFSEGWIIQKQESDDYVVQMAVRDGKQAWEPITALLFVQNKSEEPVNVSVENISFQQDEYSIDLLSYNELTQQHISRAQSRRTALALSAMAQSFSAAQSQTTTTYGSGTAYGSGGTASYYGTAQSYTHDPAASAAAQAQIQANVQAGVSKIQSDLQRNLNSMDGYLQKTTVFPGQSYSGRFQSQTTRFDQRPESIYALTVELDGERFSFKFIEEADIQTHQRKLF